MSSFSGSISQYKLSSTSPSVSIPPTAPVGAIGALADRLLNSVASGAQLSQNAGTPKFDGAGVLTPFIIAVRTASTRNFDCANAAMAKSAKSDGASGCAAMSATTAKCSGGTRFKSQIILSISLTDCWMTSPYRRSDSSGVMTSDASWTVWAATLISDGWINWHGWISWVALGSSSGSSTGSSFSSLSGGGVGSSAAGAGGSSGGEFSKFSGVSSSAGGGGGGGIAGNGFCWTFFKWFAFSAASVILRIQLKSTNCNWVSTHTLIKHLNLHFTL